ncbi:MAG: hypothetical protein AB1414_06215 [bacterium]
MTKLLYHFYAFCAIDFLLVSARLDISPVVRDSILGNRSGCNEGEMEKLGKRGKSILILVRKSYYLECH